MAEAIEVKRVAPGAFLRTFWMGYAVTRTDDGKIKIEGHPPMSMEDGRQLMHRIVDTGADDLIRRFGF